MLTKALSFFTFLLFASVGHAQTISVNFHVGDDSNAQDQHVLVSGETAGFVPVDGASWNNINVGSGAAHNTAGAIFPSTTLTDDTGSASAAQIAPSVSSTWFVGYAASSAGNAAELGLAGNDDDLFNSYLALNGPSGDGSPSDAAVLSITGIGAPYTTDGYDLIIYSDSDRGSANTSDRTSIFTVTPSGASVMTSSIEDNPVNVGDSTFDGTYVLSNGVAGDVYENYVVFSGLTAGSFTLEVTSPGGGRGAISGFQIVAGSETDPPGPDPVAEGPNVVLFVVDDMGWADWEKYSDYYETPNMTRLAAQGVEFVNAYASCSVCSPSRASLVTGLSPAAHGVTKWIPSNSNNDITNNDEPLSDFNLDPDIPTIGDAMHGGGYETCHMGKWHLGKSGNVSANPLNFGYDVNIGGSHAGGPNYTNYENNSSYPNLDLSINENHLTDHLAAEAANYIEAKVDANEKFFLSFNLYAVHTPINAHPDWISYFQSKPDGTFGHDNANYASLVRGMDEALGTILDKLEAEGIDNDTVVIFTSDHGGLTSPSITSNFPFRGGKGQQWEGGHRVPLIISGPGFQQGVTTQHQAIGHDIYPTILEMTDVDGDADHNQMVEGLSLMPPVLDPTVDRGETLFWHFPHESNHNGGPYGAVVDANYKFIEVYDTGELLLFDLAADIGEQQNVIASNSVLAEEMRQSLHDYLRDNDSALWGGQFQLLPASVLLGDVDLNGVVNFLDISPFIDRLSSGPYQAEADCDENGIINFLDIAALIAILSSS